MTPTFIDRYQIQGLLGRGGMGAVWRAHDPRLRRNVALKEVHLPEHLTAAQRANAKARVAREAQTAARIRHPSVVTIHDVLEVGDTPYIVMELLDGYSLEQRLRELGALTSHNVERIAWQLLHALREAHRAGVVHRDIKPANIVLTAEDDRAVLTDFGIAGVVDGDMTDLTGSKAILGTAEFLAPERLDRERSGPASDLWSLGATLHAGLTGRSPFRRDTVAATLGAVMAGPLPEPPREGVLRDLLGGLLVRSPERRLTTDQAIGLFDTNAPRTLSPRAHASQAHQPPPVPPTPAPPAPAPPPHGYSEPVPHWPPQGPVTRPPAPTAPQRSRPWALAGGSALVAASVTVLALMLTGLIPVPWDPPVTGTEPSPSDSPSEEVPAAPTPTPTDVSSGGVPPDEPVPPGFIRHENPYFTVNLPASWFFEEDPPTRDVPSYLYVEPPGDRNAVEVAAVDHSMLDGLSGEEYLDEFRTNMIGNPDLFQNAYVDLYPHPGHPSSWDSWVLESEYSDWDRDDEWVFLLMICTVFPDEGLAYMLFIDTTLDASYTLEEELFEIVDSFHPLQGP